MRNHLLAILALTAALTGCDTRRNATDESVQRNAWGCDACHGYPPPPMLPQDAMLSHPKGVTGQTCWVCHPRTVLPDGHHILSGGDHRDGRVEFVDYKTAVTCDTCHGTPPVTGSHPFHVTTCGLTCNDCHQGYDPAARTADDTLHMNGAPDVVLGTPTGAGSVIQTYDLPDKSWPPAECSECHAKAGVAN